MTSITNSKSSRHFFDRNHNPKEWISHQSVPPTFCAAPHNYYHPLIGATHLLFSMEIWERREAWAFSVTGSLVRSAAVTCLFRHQSFSAVFL